MKKLLYIANARMPTEKAHGIQIMKMCEAFSRNGTEVELVVPWRFNHIKQDPFAYYGVERSFSITKVPSVDLVKFGRLGFWVQTISFLFFAKLYTSFVQFDVFYMRTNFPGLFFKNYILEVHDMPGKIKPYHKKTWQKARALIVLTSFIKKALTKHGIDKNKILIAPDGVDFVEFKSITKDKKDLRGELNLVQDEKIILYVGHLYEWKGIAILLKMAEKMPQTQFYFLGGLKKDIQRLQKEYSHKNICFLGHKKRTLVPKYLKAADVLVLPYSAKQNITKYYNSPLKLFEYMASGTPIVASDLPSLREILNINNAILVEPGSVESLQKGIQTALEDGEEVANNAQKDVQNYTWQKRVRLINSFIV